jgi:hypothetical protein
MPHFPDSGMGWRASILTAGSGTGLALNVSGTRARQEESRGEGL